MAPAGDSTELLRRWHDEEDKEAREALVEQMLPLARSLARRYVNRGESLDDLEQVASVGLVKAIDRFDPGRAVQFATFAVPTISGEIKRHFRDRGWMVRVPRELQELNTRLVRAREALTRELGRSPTLDELADRAGATTERAPRDCATRVYMANAWRDITASLPGVMNAEPTISSRSFEPLPMTMHSGDTA